MLVLKPKLSSPMVTSWIVRCMAAAGAPGLQSLDVMVLHTVNHRGRAKTQADICLVLNVEDTHLVTYAIRKLARAGWVFGRLTARPSASMAASKASIQKSPAPLVIFTIAGVCWVGAAAASTAAGGLGSLSAIWM